MEMKCIDHPDKEAEYKVENPNNPITTGYYCEECAIDWSSGDYEEPLKIIWLKEED